MTHDKDMFHSADHQFEGMRDNFNGSVHGIFRRTNQFGGIQEGFETENIKFNRVLNPFTGRVGLRFYKRSSFMSDIGTLKKEQRFSKIASIEFNFQFMELRRKDDYGLMSDIGPEIFRIC